MILGLFYLADTALSAGEIATNYNVNEDLMNGLLQKLESKGFVENVDRDYYAITHKGRSQVLVRSGRNRQRATATE